LNKDRRKKLVEVVEMLRDAQELMNEVEEEEKEAYENLPYSLQGTGNSEKMEENISILRAYYDALDEMIETLEEM